LQRLTEMVGGIVLRPYVPHGTKKIGDAIQFVKTRIAKAHKETLAFRLYKDLGAGRTPHKKDGVLDVPLGG